MKLNYKHLGRRIREERIRAGISQARLAEMADSSPQYISHIENARKKASLGLIVRIANALDFIHASVVSGGTYSFSAFNDLCLPAVIGVTVGYITAVRRGKAGR